MNSCKHLDMEQILVIGISVLIQSASPELSGSQVVIFRLHILDLENPNGVQIPESNLYIEDKIQKATPSLQHYFTTLEDSGCTAGWRPAQLLSG